MELTPAKFLLLFLVIAFVGYILFTFTAKLFAWFISRTIGGAVYLRIAGLNGLKDISIQLKKGPIASVTVGELRCSLRKPWISKVQFILCDVEIVLRKSTKAKSSKRGSKHNPVGRGTWMVITNIVQKLSISVTEIAIKLSEISRTVIEIKDLDLDTFKEDTSMVSLGVRLLLAPSVVCLGDDDRGQYDIGSVFASSDKLLAERVPEAEANGRFILFSLEQLALTGNLDHDRDAGVVLKQLYAECGDAALNLSSDLVLHDNLQHVRDAEERVAEDLPEVPRERDVLPPDLAASILAKRVPETIKFSLSKFELRFYHPPRGVCFRSEVNDLSIRSTKTRPLDGSVGVLSLLDSQVELGEMRILKWEGASLLDIEKVVVAAAIEFPAEQTRPLRLEVDVKMGGAQCNLHMIHYGDLMDLTLSRSHRNSKSSGPKLSKRSGVRLCWSCSISAPDLVLITYNLEDLAVMQISSQTSHIYLNSASKGVHTELGEIYVFMLDEGKQRPVEVGVDGTVDCLMHVTRLLFDNGGVADGEDVPASAMFEAGATEVYFRLGSLKALMLTLVAAETCIQRFPRAKQVRNRPSQKRGGVLKFRLEELVVNYVLEMYVEDATVLDPKKVNFDSQGGFVTITKQGTGSRTASIKPAAYEGISAFETKQHISVLLAELMVTLDREEATTVVELISGLICYKETAGNSEAIVERTLTSVQNVKIVRRPLKSLKEATLQSLLSARNVSLHWDPDIHLLVYELVLHVKDLLRIHRRKRPAAVQEGKLSKTKAAFAVDIEEMEFVADMADGVEGALSVRSIFSEDAAIGMAFEDIKVSLNKATIVTGKQLQVSRVPSVVIRDPKLLSEQRKDVENLWDVIVQGTAVRMVMPYRLQLRAIEDAVEDMWRGLKLAMAAKRNAVNPNLFQGTPKAQRASQMQLYAVKLHMRGISAEIEEEPIQGWLDEHYRLLRQHCRELLVRERFLEEISRSKPTDQHSLEQLQEQTFQAYKKACEQLVASTGSGAWSEGFQAGFRPSLKRASLMCLSASVLDVVLTEIEGGRTGAINLIRKLDTVNPEVDVPFSRVIGRHLVLSTSNLTLTLRDYTVPMLSASFGTCEGNVIFAQQATRFQDQTLQELFVGRWRKVKMLRSVSGSTPPFKFYSELLIKLEMARVCYGVGHEPALADVSYAFTVALRKCDLSVRKDHVPLQPPVKKEKSLPWWDDMRYYVHGVNSIICSGFEWVFLATTDPYESQNAMRMFSDTMRIDQTDGRLSFLGSNFDMNISSLESIAPLDTSGSNSRQWRQSLIHAPVFQLDIAMDWKCSSGNPSNHYLHAFPRELHPRSQVYDPYRSTSLSLVWSFGLRIDRPDDDCLRSSSCPTLTRSPLQRLETFSRHLDIPVMNLCGLDLTWIFKWWSLFFSPPNKIRSFSRWPRYQVKRVPRSGNLSLDKVMTEFILRLDATPASIRHFSLAEDDPAKGLTFSMQKLRYELCFSRGMQQYTFEGPRDILELVYQGLDVHMLKAKLKRVCEEGSNFEARSASAAKSKEEGFLFFTDCFTIRKQSPKADPDRLSPWRENIQSGGFEHYKLSESESDPAYSDNSEDEEDDFDVVCADNCLRVSLYGFKLFWTIQNRNAVWAWVADFSKAFEAPKPSPSKQYAQRKLLEEKQKAIDGKENEQKVEDISDSHQGSSSSKLIAGTEQEEGTLQFTVNVVQPQFNLHSEHAQGRFLLAAASGRVIARSFHSVLYLALDEADQALEKGVPPPQGLPEISWKRRELSVMLEHVQAHVAPTDVDPGAGLQWLPRIPKGAPKVKRTGALLERVFLPCSMYFQYTRHKAGTTDCKVKPLKELSFNSPDISATMTSRQFHIMVDVMSSLLLARLPKPQKKEDEEDDLEEDADEVVPDGVEEVELARIRLEQAERDVRLIYDDLKTIKQRFKDIAPPDGISSPEQHHMAESPEGNLQKLRRTSTLVRRLEIDLALKRKSRNAALAFVRNTLQRAASQRLMDKEKNKSPSAAMRISWILNRVAWTMLTDGKAFAEAEINHLTLNVDRDFKDNGVARFTVKSFVVRNLLSNAKSNTVLSAWNAPLEWGKTVMLRVDARQGAPKEGLSYLELFQVEIYPLKIYLTEMMYSMMWEYFFPAEQDAQRRKEVWKASKNSGTKRIKKGGTLSQESSLHAKEVSSKAESPNNLSRHDSESLKPSRSQHLIEHRRSMSLDKTWETTEFASGNLLARTSTAPGDEILATLYASKTVEIETTKVKRSTKLRKTSPEEKKESRARKVFLEIRNIKISQVELLVTYAGSKLSVSDLRLLMDTFTKNEFAGSWRKLFSRVKKHIIWGVLKSLTGMQGKKFKDKMQAQGSIHYDDSDSSSDSASGSDRFLFPHLQKRGDRAGEGFVSSIRGLFNSQKRKAKALVRTMRGDADNQSEWRSDGEADSFSQLYISSRSGLLRRQSRKFRSKGAILLGERYCSSSPRAHSDAESSGTSTYEDLEQHLT